MPKDTTATATENPRSDFCIGRQSKSLVQLLMSTRHEQTSNNHQPLFKLFSLYFPFSQSPFFSNKNRSSRLPLSGAPEKKKFLKILNTQKCAQPGPYNTHAAIINAMKYIGALITLTPLTFTLGNTCLCLSHVRIAEGRE